MHALHFHSHKFRNLQRKLDNEIKVNYNRTNISSIKVWKSTKIGNNKLFFSKINQLQVILRMNYCKKNEASLNKGLLNFPDDSMNSMFALKKNMLILESDWRHQYSILAQGAKRWW